MCRTRELVTRCGGVQSPLALRSGKPNLCAHVVGDVDGVCMVASGDTTLTLHTGPRHLAAMGAGKSISPKRTP